MSTLAIDFDGVINDHKHPLEGRRMGAPIEGAGDKLRMLKHQGYRIIIFSVWGDDKGRESIAEWMKHFEIPYDHITNTKPHADVYLDDKAIRFTNWDDFEQQLQSACTPV